MLDAGQELWRLWPTILVLRLHSGSVGPALRVDFGFIKSYSTVPAGYMYMHYNQLDMTTSYDVRNKLGPLYYFCIWKNKSQWFKKGELIHSSIWQVI